MILVPVSDSGDATWREWYMMLDWSLESYPITDHRKNKKNLSFYIFKGVSSGKTLIPLVLPKHT